MAETRRRAEALIGVFGSKGAWPKKGREQGSMNERLGSLGAQEFFWEIILKILCFSVKFLALSNDCKDSPFLTINAICSSNVSIPVIVCLHFVNIALKEAFFARMKKVSPKVFKVRICIKHCTNFDSNSGKTREGKVFYVKLRGVAMRFLCYPCPNHLSNFHCAMSECTGLLRGLCKTVREIINSIVLLKLLKEQYLMTGLLGSVDHEIFATGINKQGNHKGTTLATHVLI